MTKHNLNQSMASLNYIYIYIKNILYILYIIYHIFENDLKQNTIRICPNMHRDTITKVYQSTSSHPFPHPPAPNIFLADKTIHFQVGSERVPGGPMAPKATNIFAEIEKRYGWSSSQSHLLLHGVGACWSSTLQQVFGRLRSF